MRLLSLLRDQASLAVLQGHTHAWRWHNTLNIWTCRCGAVLTKLGLQGMREGVSND